jgi:hypothetical protein
MEPTLKMTSPLQGKTRNKDHMLTCLLSLLLEALFGEM